MEEINLLLNTRWVLKKRDPELYFRLKDKHGIYREFFRDKLGYNLILNPLLIKAEKIPGKAQPWMGIPEFDSTMDYVFLCLALMFLEEMEPEEQFVLAQITDYVKNQYPGEEPVDWTVFSHRRSLIKVLRFCMEEGMVVLTDGDDRDFTGSEELLEVLYENTGVSKYFMRRFPVDISGLRSLEELENLEWQSEERDRGIIRRHRVYRRLVMEPVVYQEGSEDPDYLYLRMQRSVISHDMEKFLGAAFHLHQNGAMVVLPAGSGGSGCIPNRRNITDIALQTCQMIRRHVDEGRLRRDAGDRIVLSEVAWEELLREVSSTFGPGWSKQYRQLGAGALGEELSQTMEAFGMIRVRLDSREVVILPVAGKMVGDYPADYWRKQQEEEPDGAMAD